MAWPRRTEPWGDREIDALKEMWAQGKSASEIAAQLRERTRSAVLGQVARLRREGKLPAACGPAPAPGRTTLDPQVSRPPPAAPAWPVTRAEDRKPPKRILARAPTPTTRPWLMRDRDECRWPFERDDGFWSCCAKVHPGQIYCADHCRIAYQGWSPERAKAARAERLRRRA